MPEESLDAFGEPIRSSSDLNAVDDKVQSGPYQRAIRSNLDPDKVQFGLPYKQTVNTTRNQHHEDHRPAAPTGAPFSPEEEDELSRVGATTPAQRNEDPPLSSAPAAATAAETVERVAVVSATRRIRANEHEGTQMNFGRVHGKVAPEAILGERMLSNQP